MNDLISRQEAIDLIERMKLYYCLEPEDIMEMIDHMPSAQPELTEKVEEILSYLDTELHPLVSPEHWNVYSDLYDMISALPTAQPERKKGKWLRDPPEGGYALWKCSVCGECWLHWWASAMTVEEMTKEVRCCPNCGVDMREEKQDAEIH